MTIEQIVEKLNYLNGNSKNSDNNIGVLLNARGDWDRPHVERELGLTT